MGFHPEFPSNPYAILEPDIRWYPGEEIKEKDNLIPPLVNKIRKGVKGWRDNNYVGASKTTIALLQHWFKKEHTVVNCRDQEEVFRWYFAQREALESVIWLYEIQKSKDPIELLKYDSSGKLTSSPFLPESVGDWTRYVIKLATGAGKTKILSLLIAWCYFHKKYEPGSDLSTNFLLIAPNIIVLERLKVDFDNLRIFCTDPIIPENGYEGKNWMDDFNLSLHLQDEIGRISDTGNLFLTNVHRIFLGTERQPGFEDEDLSDYFLGPKPSGKTTDSKLDLGLLIRTIPDLVVLNDEAHHIHDSKLSWFKNIQDIAQKLKEKGSKLSAQFDVTATPKHENGALFAQTISDYPLTEAIRQGIVKTPILPDQTSRGKLMERTNEDITERYRDYIHLGYLEWKKTSEIYKEYKKPLLFIMTEDTSSCDALKLYLEAKYSELINAVLVIHTKKDGTIEDGKVKELDQLRKQVREVDNLNNPFKVIISVLMLREGWDVKNVTTIVGLRAFSGKNKILPEQTLGRGLRKMSENSSVPEWLSVIGTDAFMEFVESIKAEGVDLEYQAMDEKSIPKAPEIVRVDLENKNKNLSELDIEIPILSGGKQKNYKDLNEIQVDVSNVEKVEIIEFSDIQIREVVFRDITTEEINHTTLMDFLDDDQTVSGSIRAPGYFAAKIIRDLHMVGGFEILYEKIKYFIQYDLFNASKYPVDIDDPNIIRNLSESIVRKIIIETFKKAINDLTYYEQGTTEVRNTIKLANTRAFEAKDRYAFKAKKCIFNKVVVDNQYELDFAKFLDKCGDLISFAKNNIQIGFFVEYVSEEGDISKYYPDFMVKKNSNEVWIIELKGREDLNDLRKRKRLKEWCEEATLQVINIKYKSLYIKQEEWEKYKTKNFSELCVIHEKK